MQLSKQFTHTVIPVKKSVKIIIQLFYLPHFPLWFSIFLHDRIECQTNKRFYFKPNKMSPPLSYYENATHFNYRISMDTKVLFLLYLLITPTFLSSSTLLVTSLLLTQQVIFPLNMLFKLFSLHWITKFEPPHYLVIDRDTKYVNQDMTHLGSPFKTNHSPRTPFSNWTNGLLEVHNRNNDTHLRIFYKLLHFLSIYYATYCTSFPSQTHYSNQDFNLFFQSLLDRPISAWLLSAEHAMLEIYSTTHRHTTSKLYSQSITFETAHLKQVPLNSFVIRTNFKPVKISQILKPLRLGLYKIIMN